MLYQKVENVAVVAGASTSTNCSATPNVSSGGDSTNEKGKSIDKSQNKKKRKKMDIMTEGLYRLRPIPIESCTQLPVLQSDGKGIKGVGGDGVCEGDDSDLPYECLVCGKSFRLEQVLVFLTTITPFITAYNTPVWF